MTIDKPLWLQNLEYPARIDRGLLEVLPLVQGVADFGLNGLKVTQRAAGTNLSVDVAPGFAIIEGTEAADQGKYSVHVTAFENHALAAAHLTLPRIDLVVITVKDSAVVGADDEAIIQVITGTPGVTPAAPATPDSSIAIAQIDVAANTAVIVNADIGDLRVPTFTAGPLDVKDFGAGGLAIADDRAAIQRAIDYANGIYELNGWRVGVYISPGRYRLGVVNYYTDAMVNVGICSLMMRDGVDIDGPGELFVEDNAYGGGAFYRAIASRDSGLSHASIRGITINGNKDNQVASDQCSNILLECLDDVTVDNVKSIDANGNGIMLRGTLSVAATNLAITNNMVTGATMIGIQSSQFFGLVIGNNRVSNCDNNGIDIYGDDGTNICHGHDFAITGNVVTGCLVGIFPETVRDGTVSGNAISACDYGVVVNRIVGEPRDITITGNSIASCGVGAQFSGDMGGVVFVGNTVWGFITAGVNLGAGGGNCSMVNIIGNFFDCIDTVHPMIHTEGGNVVWNVVRNNITTITDVAWWYQHTASVEHSNVYERPDVATGIGAPTLTPLAAAGAGATAVLLRGTDLEGVILLTTGTGAAGGALIKVEYFRGLVLPPLTVQLGFESGPLPDAFVDTQGSGAFFNIHGTPLSSSGYYISYKVLPGQL